MGRARDRVTNQHDQDVESSRSTAPSCKNIPRKDVNLSEVIERVYNPDERFQGITRPKTSLLTRFVESLFTWKDEKPYRKTDIPGIEYARLFEVNMAGGYRLRTIHSTEELREAIRKAYKHAASVHRMLESGIKLVPDETITKDERKLRENFFDLEDQTQTQNGVSSFAEYIPIMGGPFSKQLYLHDMLDGFAKAFEATNHNPVAHQAVRVITYFVLGRGVTFKACHPECQDRWDEWSDKLDLNTRLEFWSDTITRDGELMLRKVKDRIRKELSIRWIDPSTIWEIVTDLEDMETGCGASSIGVIFYHQQYPTQYQTLYGGGDQQQFDPSKFQSTKYVINQIPANEVLHYKINVGPNEKRGRSDHFPVLGWLKRYKDYWTAVVLRAIVQSTFAWKNKLKGADTDVTAFISSFGAQQPEFGGVWVENESSELTAMTADIKGSMSESNADGIVDMIAVGYGIPSQYLGFSGKSNSRASAVVGSEPGTKKFQSRQQLFGRVIRDIAQDWGRIEIEEGRLPAMVEDQETGGQVEHVVKIEPQFPEIAIEDRTAKIKDIDFAVTGKYIPHEEGAKTIAKELGMENYDYDKAMAKIAAEEENRSRDIYNRPTPIPTDPQIPQAGAGGAAVPGNPMPGQAVGATGSPAGAGQSGAPKAGLAGKVKSGLSGKERRDIKSTHRS